MIKTEPLKKSISKPNPWDRIRDPLLSVSDEEPLLELIKEILTIDEDECMPIEVAELLREKVFLIFVSKLSFYPALFKLYPLFNSKNFTLPPHGGMSYIKNKLLNDHYEKADQINKEAILILVLLIDILNQNKEEGVKDFIVRYADIDVTVKEFLEIIDILNITPEDVINIYIESGIFSPHIFMNKSIMAQKRNFLLLLRFFNTFRAPLCYVKLYDQLKMLFYESIKAKDIELVLYIGFFIRFYYGNLNVSHDAWERLDKEIEKPMSDFFVRYCKDNNILPCNKRPEKGKKIRVGYAYQQLIFSSPVSVLLSLLKGHYLNRNMDIEFYVYGYDYKEKIGDTDTVVNIIESMGFKCISAGQLGDFKDLYHSHFEKAMALRKQIMEDEIDIFVTTGTQIGNFLVSSRVAPVQIYWSHIDPYWNVNNLDCRIVHSAEGSVTKGLYGGIEYFKFPNLAAMEFLNPNVSQEKIDKIRLKFPEGKILLGVFGRLAKLEHPDYLFAISEILKRNPETVFLICGYGDKQCMEEYFKTVGCLDRVYFEGHVNPHVYGQMIDIALDSFPVPMGLASLEVGAKGKPMVSFKVNLDEINEFRLKDVLASTIEDYIQIADKLIKDKMFRKEIGEKYRKFIEEKLDCRRAAKELERLYNSLSKEYGDIKIKNV